VTQRIIFSIISSGTEVRLTLFSTKSMLEKKTEDKLTHACYVMLNILKLSPVVPLEPFLLQPLWSKYFFRNERDASPFLS